jgi:hypothetical protein
MPLMCEGQEVWICMAGTLACAYNPSTWRGGDWEDLHVGKKVSETASQQNKPGMVMCICSPSYAGSIGRRMLV